MMRAGRGLLGVLVSLVLMPLDAGAQVRDIACGSTYAVARGDTLRAIALRANGNENYQAIFDANRNILPSPDLLEVDQQLFIPCTPADAATVPAQQAVAAPRATPTVVTPTVVTPTVVTPTVVTSPPLRIQQGDASQRQIRFLTAGDYAPFTDEALPEGGMFTDLVRQSMKRADPQRPFRITFVNDWGPHLNILLPEGAFDLGFPWFKPDCTKIDRLSEAMASRYNDFEFSDPFYQVVIGFYVRKGDPLVRAGSYDDLQGKTICRPRGYFTFDLEQENLKAPNVTMSVPATPAECFSQLVAGEVDVVSLNVLISEKEISKQGLSGQVVELSDLAGVQTLHVLAARSNPSGRSYLALINRGLQGVRESGDWFSIVSSHLSRHAVRTD